MNTFAIGSALVAGITQLRHEVSVSGGWFVMADCRMCGKAAFGRVVIDDGRDRSEHAPAIPRHLYVTGYVRGCNCNVGREQVEAGLVAGVFEDEVAA
jgi:hypothetical protein